VRLWICGTRGSTPAPGSDFVRYGGNTSCVAIGRDGDAPTLVLDGGTGLRRLTTVLDGAPFRGTVLIGHLHWDHTHGLPFFRAGDQPDARVRVLIPEQGDASEVMARAVSPPHFPLRLEDLRGEWSVGSIDEGTYEVEGFTVLAREIPHKMSRTFGFRITDGTATIAYLSDHAPANEGPGPHGFGPYHEAARALCDGVDLVIHDAQYTAEEFPLRKDFGHSAIDYAIGLAKESSARALMLFHHDPDRTDDQIDAILAAQRNGSIAIDAAVEGSVVDLPR
jgi:phosphoribosyl 1,2-cyclic phosphodiesterase